MQGSRASKGVRAFLNWIAMGYTNAPQLRVQVLDFSA